MTDFKGLLSIAAGYLPEGDLEPVTKAYEFAKERHAGQKHLSGLAYVEHLVEVAHTLAAMKLDRDTIVAGLLHGVLKERVATRGELEKMFGSAVTNIVDGSTRITNVQYSSRLAHEAENIRKLFVAMSSDIRVLLVKLADRLQDMLTLGLAAEERQRELARETKDLYAPLAGRLGIDWLKRELEDLAFQYLHPLEYADLTKRLESSMAQRQAYVDDVIAILRKKLQQSNIKPHRVIGRPKHLASIYKKLVAQNVPLERIYDKVAFRIIVGTVKECYETLGTVHANWPPVPNRIKDFISSPKSNNYQSLHTTVIGPGGHFIEIQIRTEEMDRVAQEGIAAHWAYKEGQKVKQSDVRLFRDLKRLVRVLQEVKDAKEFLESVRSELFEPDVYALTPKGEVRELPKGSTPIDFAYSIHTVIGDSCSGAKVNGQLVSLRYELKSGDIVEIITSKKQHPKRSWLQYVKTNRARTRVRQWLRREEREKALQLGRELCERELKKHEVSLKKLIKSGHIRRLLKNLGTNSLEDMLVKVGAGEISLQQVLRVLQPEESPAALEDQAQPVGVGGEQRGAAEIGEEIGIEGLSDMLVRVSQCCKPVPGDRIAGFITTGRGISIHKSDCPNLNGVDPARRLLVSWSAAAKTLHRAELSVIAESQRSIITDISSIINADNANLQSLTSRSTGENLLEITIVVEVLDLNHLQNLQQHLRQLPLVVDVWRR